MATGELRLKCLGTGRSGEQEFTRLDGGFGGCHYKRSATVFVILDLRFVILDLREVIENNWAVSAKFARAAVLDQRKQS